MGEQSNTWRILLRDDRKDLPIIETVVHELKAYFGFFRLHHTSETILRFYSYDRATNYVRCRMVHFKEIDDSLWYSVSLLYTSGVIYLGNSHKLKDWPIPTMTTSSRNYRHPSKVIVMLVSVFKKDGNLDFRIRKTKVLTEGASVDHLFEHTKHFLDTDPDLEDIGHHFTREPLLFNENDTQ